MIYDHESGQGGVGPTCQNGPPYPCRMYVSRGRAAVPVEWPTTQKLEANSQRPFVSITSRPALTVIGCPAPGSIQLVRMRSSSTVYYLCPRSHFSFFPFELACMPSIQRISWKRGIVRESQSELFSSNCHF